LAPCRWSQHPTQARRGKTAISAGKPYIWWAKRKKNTVQLCTNDNPLSLSCRKCPCSSIEFILWGSRRLRSGYTGNPGHIWVPRHRSFQNMTIMTSLRKPIPDQKLP
jgi:hypothetical protein